jgi:hypothetical protein
MMSAAQLLLAHLVKLCILAILVGLFARRRAHLCWSFVAYLTAILVGNSMVSFWPEQFYRKWFYILKEGVYNALMVAVAAELAYKTFRAFPGAASRARQVLAPIFAFTALFVISVPRGATYEDLVTLYHPQVVTGAIWIMTGISLLIAWYRVPVHAMHRAILLGFASYLLIFTTLLNILRDFGFENLWRPLGLIDTYAYLGLMAWWAYAAWVPAYHPVLSLNVLRRLQLEPV